MTTIIIIFELDTDDENDIDAAMRRMRLAAEEIDGEQIQMLVPPDFLKEDTDGKED